MAKNKGFSELNISIGSEYKNLSLYGLAGAVGFMGCAPVLSLLGQTLIPGVLDFIAEHEVLKGGSNTSKIFIDGLQLILGLGNLAMAAYQLPIINASIHAIAPEIATNLDQFVISLYGPNPSVPLAFGLANLYASSALVNMKTIVQEGIEKTKEYISKLYQKVKNSELFETALFIAAGTNTYIALDMLANSDPNFEFNPIIALVPIVGIYIFEKIIDYSRVKASVDHTGNETRQKIRNMIHNLTYPITQYMEYAFGTVYFIAGLYYTPLFGDAIRAGLELYGPGLSQEIDAALKPFVGNNPLTAFLTAGAFYNAARYEPTITALRELD